MNRTRILPILLLSTAIVAPLPHGSWAQDTAATESNVTEDSNILERLIQDVLGGEGRTVRVVGLDGLLSSEVSIAQIEIADADGPWLEVKDVVLNWRRTALLRKRLEVDAMTIGTIEVLRKPLPGPEKPALQADEEAQPFALPELPVSVNVAQLGVGGLILRDPVIGQQILMSINGSASLQDGEGALDIAALRVDDRKGDFKVSAGFENETSRLYVDLDVIEDAGGIIASLAKIPEEPSLSITVKGDDVISDFKALIDFRTDDIERLAGFVSIQEDPPQQGQTDPSMVITAQLGGDIADLFLPEYRDFFGSNIALDVVARQNAATGLLIEQLDIAAAALDVSGQIDLAPSFLPRSVDLKAVVATPSGLPVILPLTGSPILINRADLTVAYDEAAGDSFDVDLLADGVMHSDGHLIDTISAAIDGTLIKDGDTGLQSVDATLDANLIGFSTTNPALWDAAGDDLSAKSNVSWAKSAPIEISDLAVVAGDITLTGDATVSGVETGAITLAANLDSEVGDLDRFSAITGQDLGGAISAGVTADFNAVTGGFDVALLGQTTDLTVGPADADQLLAGKTDLQLNASRDAQGIAVDDLSIKGRFIDLAGDLALAPDGFPKSIDLSGTVGDKTGASVVLPVPGAETVLQWAALDVTYDADAGEEFSADITAADLVRADGYALGMAEISSRGTLSRASGSIVDQIAGQISAKINGLATPDPELTKAVADGVQLQADVKFDAAPGDLVVSGLQLSSGDLRLTGDADVSNIGKTDAMTLQSNLDVATGDVARFAALVKQPIAGSLNATATADMDLSSGFFDVALDGVLQDLMLGTPDPDQLLAGKTDIRLVAARDDSGIALDELVLQGEKIDIGGTAHIAPDYFPDTIDIAGRVGNPSGGSVLLPIPGAEARLQNIDLDISFDAAAGDDFNADITASGLSAQGFGLETAMIEADGTLTRGSGTVVEQISATLAAALSGVSTPDPAMTESLSAGLTLSADADFDAKGGELLLNALTISSADLQMSGEAKASNIGTDTPIAAMAKMKVDTGELSRFAALAGTALQGRLVADATASYDVGTGYFDVDLSGEGQELAAGIAQVDQLIRGKSSIELRAKNDETGLTLEALDLDTAEITVNGSGTLTENDGQINLDATLSDMGLLASGFNGPLRTDAVITSASGVWALDGNVEGPGGSNAAISGDVLRPDGTMDLALTGGLPMGLLNGVLAPRNVDGTATFDIKVAGTPGLEAVSGTVTVDNSRFSDPATRLALENLGVRVAIANSQANLEVGANLSTGGRISVTGPINLTGDIPAELQITLDKLVLLDPRLYEVNLDGDISVNGPLTGGALIAGRIDIGRSEIKVPTGLGGATSIPDITHLGEGGASHLTRERAGLVKEEKSSSGGGGVAYPLDILISAPREIYVRGRGLDVEMAGEIQISGSTAALNTTGGLNLVRGRLNILSQRLDFEEAEISLQGDLVPDIRMVAVSDSSDINAMIVIEGPVTDPEIELRSEPELPEDEVLSQLFFGKPVQDLSPLELAQLAAAVSELTGGSGGLFGKIRDGIGVDDLDVSTDEDGNTDVTAGKYITDRVYTDVTVGSDGTSEIQLNYEITNDFKVRGGFDNEGNTGVGLTYELDY